MCAQGCKVYERGYNKVKKKYGFSTQHAQIVVRHAILHTHARDDVKVGKGEATADRWVVKTRSVEIVRAMRAMRDLKIAKRGMSVVLYVIAHTIFPIPL